VRAPEVSHTRHASSRTRGRSIGTSAFERHHGVCEVGVVLQEALDALPVLGELPACTREAPAVAPRSVSEPAPAPASFVKVSVVVWHRRNGSEFESAGMRVARARESSNTIKNAPSSLSISCTSERQLATSYLSASMKFLDCAISLARKLCAARYKPSPSHTHMRPFTYTSAYHDAHTSN